MRSINTLKSKLQKGKNFININALKRLASLFSVLLLASSLLVANLLPLKVSAASGTYLALGDSFSAGFGENVFNTVASQMYWQNCGRSGNAYPHLLNSGFSDFYFEACSGATASIGVPGNTMDQQTSEVIRQFVKLRKIPTHITLTIGGNNVGFKDIIWKCAPASELFGDDGCGDMPISEFLAHPERDAYRRFTLSSVKVQVETTLKALKATWPGAQIWIAGYPRMFTPEKPGEKPDICLMQPVGSFNYNERVWLGKLADDLNQTIYSAASGIGVKYVNASKEFYGHNLCDSDTYFNLTFHPKDSGHEAYKKAFQAAGFSSTAKYSLSSRDIVCDPDRPGTPCYDTKGLPLVNTFSTGIDTPLPPNTGINGAKCEESLDKLLMFESVGFGGRCASLGIGEYSNLRSINFAWQMSSLKMGSQLRAVFCEGENFTGRCEGFDRSDEDIHNDSWGDKVGSLKIDFKPAPPPGGLGDPTCTEGPKKVVLYEIQGFGGRCTAMEIGDYPAQWMFAPLPSDLLSSMKVGDDVSVQMCAQENFVDCTTWGTDADLSNDGWNDRMKSMRIYLTPPQPVCSYSADQIAIHDWPNFRGSCATMDIGTYPTPANIPANLNDQIESVRVGANVKAWMCADPNFESTCSMVTGDINLSNLRVNGQSVSSIKVMPKDEPGPCEGTFEEIVLFEYPGYEGTCRVFKLGVSGIMYADPDYYVRYLNDRAQSVKVNPGAKVTLCQDAYLSGRCSTFTESVSNLQGTWVGDRSVSSLNVERSPAFVCNPNSNQFAIYDQVNFQGECTIFAPEEESLNLSATGKLGNQRAESIRVGANVRAFVCQGLELTDNCDQFNVDDPDLSDNLIGSNRIQSMRNRPKHECQSQPGMVVFFDKPNYDGLCIRSRAVDFPDSINLYWLTNNRIESIRIAEDLQLKLCLSDKSVCMTLRGDISNLAGFPVGPNLTYYAKMEPRTFACATFMYYSEYFDNLTLSGTPVTKRCESTPNYSWGATAPPETNLPNDNFSVRWTSEEPRIGGVYTFRLTNEDGARLWVDNQLVLNPWLDQSAPKTNGVNRLLNSGDHSFKMEYYKKTGNGTAKLDITRYVAPTSCNASSFKADYFNNTDLSGTPIFTRCEASINYAWGKGSPSNAIVGPDNFSVRWLNTKAYVAGKYRFSLTVDDGVRVWVDNQLVLDKWLQQTTGVSYTFDRDLTAGNHTVKIEYFEKSGNAIAKFLTTQLP